ncbi:related to transcription factor MBP1 [Sporisorium reilianum f. sp. reilianum]|uniref:Related to transcription factor MBP1 n=1 Tax=Sporisorium reilianum f. sp. reilianum TaxID=72559 RepID=A0A2N8UMM2_9BASI|nr:related to transcription factor MBP1 [Sporisorium reilianum f. sp. reilianum]
MPLNPSATTSIPTVSFTHAPEATSLPATSSALVDTINPLRPVQEVAASSLVDSASSPHASLLDQLKPSTHSASSNLSFTTSALQRAGLLPTHASSTMSATAASGASAASETLQRVMGHGAASAAATNGASTPAQAGPLTPAQLKNMTPAQANAALQNPVGNVPTVYLATYSNVPVYEITVRGIAVMRRRADGWLNATQILKIAGIEKTRRTKILEKSILTGEHEKIQGGYGKFQGTWIPLQRAQEVAAEYNVSHLLQPILEFDPATADQIPKLYQRKKPASSARNSSALAINDGRGSTPSKLYSPAPPSIGGPSQQPRFLALRPPKDTQQREMSPALFMPPGATGLLGNGAYATDGAVPPAGPQAIPPGSSQAEQEALRSYNVYGYTPQGVPLPASAAADAAAATAVAGDKRTAAQDDQQDASAAKRSRVTSPQQQARDSGLLLGPSPVKDLNALGPAGGSLRAASAPRGHRMAVGPPDAAGRDGSVPRYADRALAPKPYDEGEKRMRDRLVSLFSDDGVLDAATAAATGAAASASAADEDDDAYVAKLDSLLADLREKASLGRLGASASDGPKPTVDLITDDHGHTALHWASALCRLKLVRTLVARPPWLGGANVHAGNHAGETALHRSVLVTNSYDASSFPKLLHLLSSSLNTRDFKKRTVLHHIALVAALKGRAASARYYLACVLEHIAAEKSSKYKGLVDAQDEDGETALGIVARLGNASMVRMLLDVGARKDLPNALGIRPSDWGIESGSDAPSQSQNDAGSVAGASTVSSLPPLTAADLASQNPSDIISALTRPAQVPVMKSSDVRDQLSSTLDDLQSTFERELKEKQDAISTVQSHLQAATRDLAARRKTVSAAQGKLAEKDEARQRVQNLRRAIVAQLGWDEADAAVKMDELENEAASAASSSSKPADAMDVDDAEDVKPVLPSGPGPLIDDLLASNTIEADLKALGATSVSAELVEQEQLVRLRWLVSFFQSSCDDLTATIAELEDSSATKEAQCQQVVAICANIPQDKVEGMLTELLTAMESDGPDVDLARVANFMQKVGKSGENGEQPQAGGAQLSTSTSLSTTVSSAETAASSVVPAAEGEGVKEGSS